MASNDMDRLKELVDHLDNLPKPSFDKVLELLSSQTVINKPEDERLAVWLSLTKFISKHKLFSDAEWALNGDIVSKIEAVAEKLAPKNPLNLYLRLFNGRDYDLYDGKEDWKEQQQKFEEDRQRAIKEILSYGGLDAVVKFAQSVESPSSVGFSLGAISEPAIDPTIFPEFLESENKKLAEFARGFAGSRHFKHGWTWADGLDRSTWSAKQIGQFLSCLPFTKEAWTRAPEWLGKDEIEYWSRARVIPYQTDGDFKDAIDKLIEYKRPYAAIDCLNRALHAKQPLDRARSVKALLSGLSSVEPSYSMDIYNTVEIIKALQKDPDTDPDDLFRVEWTYLPLLEQNQGATPKLLENRLATDPGFFCKVIRLIYRSKKKEKPDKEPSERDKQIATNAWRLLHDWKTPPGTQADGSFSGEQFLQWFMKTVEACAESGHLEVALTHIGQVLFYCPADPEGLWIDKTAADVLNGKDAERMRNGFRTEAFNSRGVHWVDPTGKPERELAEQCKKKAEDIENAGYQRFAVTLRGLSESYNRDAERIIAEHNAPNID